MSGRNRAIYVGLAVLGIVYSVLGIYWREANALKLIPMMDANTISSMLLRPLYTGVVLAPITIVLTAPRLKPAYGLVAMLAYGIIMTVAIFIFEGFDFITALGTFAVLPFNYLLQVPIWGLTLLVMFLIRRIGNRGHA
jgi:hypothetical protein